MAVRPSRALTPARLAAAPDISGVRAARKQSESHQEQVQTDRESERERERRDRTGPVRLTNRGRVSSLPYNITQFRFVGIL